MIMNVQIVTDVILHVLLMSVKMFIITFMHKVNKRKQKNYWWKGKANNNIKTAEGEFRKD